jgi:alpha/beta superfamily hydrolase
MHVPQTLRKILTYGALVLVLVQPSRAQRYLQPVINQVQTVNGIVYGQAITNTGTSQTLAMDFYVPVESNAAPRPVMVFFHGGSFVGGTRNDPVMTRLCQEFARRGYVTATASYRLGVSISITNPLDAEFAKAAIRATQDAKAVVRFLRRTVAEGVTGQSGLNPFGMDTNRIFIGGYSAGAITALHAAYFRDTTLATPLVRNMLRVIGGGWRVRPVALLIHPVFMVSLIWQGPCWTRSSCKPPCILPCIFMGFWTMSFPMPGVLPPL